MSTELEDMEFSFLNDDDEKVQVSVEENSSDEPVPVAVETKEDKQKESVPEVQLKKVSEKEVEVQVETKIEAKPKKETPKKKYDPNCTSFRLDPAGEFGTCIHCGRKKKDHEQKGQNKAATLLQNLKARNSTVGEESEMVSKGDGPCAHFRLDPAAAFGTCRCGYKRQEHAEKKKNNAELALERLRSSNANDWRKMSTEVEGECVTFKLDTAAADFGACVFCGKKKGEHGEKKKNKAKELLENLKKKNEEKHKIEDLKADGIDVTPEETENPVEELTKEETAANQPVAVDAKKGGCCVIS